MVLDQPLVDHAFERLFAEAIDARGRERVAADVLAVDDRHHVVLAAAPAAATRPDSPRCLRRLRLGCTLRASRRAKHLRIGLRRSRVTANRHRHGEPCDAAGDHHQPLLAPCFQRMVRLDVDENLLL